MPDLRKALMEDAAGQEVLRTAEQAERLKKLKALCASRTSVEICPTEDDHVFTSYGQCSKCGAHRMPR